MLPKLTPLCRRRRRRRQRCTVHCQRVPPVLSGPPFTVPNECTALWRLACLQQLLLRVSEIDDAWHKIAGKIQSRPDLPITRDDQHASAICPRRSRAACAWRCACESDTLGAVAIMVKSERRGDRIISAFTGRKAPAGSCRGGGAGHPGRPPWIKKTGSRPRSRDARTELRDGEYFV